LPKKRKLNKLYTFLVFIDKHKENTKMIFLIKPIVFTVNVIARTRRRPDY
jgi:hypothetical protein